MSISLVQSAPNQSSPLVHFHEQLKATNVRDQELSHHRQITSSTPIQKKQSLKRGDPIFTIGIGLAKNDADLAEKAGELKKLWKVEINIKENLRSAGKAVAKELRRTMS